MSDGAGNFRARGGGWVVAQFTLMTAVLALAIGFHGDGMRWPVIAAGAGLIVVGGWFGMAGVKRLGCNRTPFPQPREDSALVQDGIYARVRHPIYTSVMLVSVGWALVWESWPALVIALLQIPFFAAKARREERWLRDRFPGYADYARRVPAFFPWRVDR